MREKAECEAREKAKYEVREMAEWKAWEKERHDMEFWVKYAKEQQQKHEVVAQQVAEAKMLQCQV